MKKRRLDLDALAVESFDAAAVPDVRGTERGYFTNTPNICNTQWSCGGTCGYDTCAC